MFMVEHLSLTLAAQKSVTKIIHVTIMNLVTPKAQAKHDHLFIKPASEARLLNKSSCLTPSLGVTKFIIVTNMIWVTLCCAT